MESGHGAAARLWPGHITPPHASPLTIAGKQAEDPPPFRDGEEVTFHTILFLGCDHTGQTSSSSSASDIMISVMATAGKTIPAFSIGP